MSDDGPIHANPQLQITILGSGTSHGVPMIACDCDVCRSGDPRDHRNRTSAAVRVGAPDGPVILIDASPELRLSAIAVNLTRVNAVLLTHAHADHIMGLDDLRRYNSIARRPITVYGDHPTLDVVTRCFAYAFNDHTVPERPHLSAEVIDQPTEICGAIIQPVPLMHGRTSVLGYRIGSLAYCTDCSAIPAASMEMLKNLDVLVLDALRYTPHPTHFNIPQALEVVSQLRPRRAILTHITHEVSHAKTSRELPAGVELAYDGMTIDVAG